MAHTADLQTDLSVWTYLPSPMHLSAFADWILAATGLAFGAAFTMRILPMRPGVPILRGCAIAEPKHKLVIHHRSLVVCFGLISLPVGILCKNIFPGCVGLNAFPSI